MDRRPIIGICTLLALAAGSAAGHAGEASWRPEGNVEFVVGAGAGGENDRIAPLSGQKATVGLFPNARLVVLPTVGHLIHYEASQGAADAIRAFVDSL